MAGRKQPAKESRLAGFCAIALLLGTANAGSVLGQSDEESRTTSSSAIRVGQVAPAWSPTGWVNSQPLAIDQLRGKVLLLRFFSDNPTGAAALNEFYRTRRDQGLTVVGFYAPQPMPGETDSDHVRRLVSALGFEFPVAVDARWETLNRYWLEQVDADMAAATFLIDRRGVIQYIQAAGPYEKNSANRTLRREYENLQRQIERLLQQSSQGSKESTAKPGPRSPEDFTPREHR